MHLSMHKLVALPVDWELTKFLETQLGNNLGAHVRIIYPRRNGSPTFLAGGAGVIWNSGMFADAIMMTAGFVELPMTFHRGAATFRDSISLAPILATSTSASKIRPAAHAWRCQSS